MIIMKLFNKDIPSDNRILKYKIKNEATRLVGIIFRYLILISMGYVILYPLMYMITSAIRQDVSYYDPSTIWITNKVTWSNIVKTIDLFEYFNGLKNTLLYEIIASFIQLFVCSIIAYGLARFNFKLKKPLMFILIVSIMIPVQMTILPTFVNYSHLDVLGIFGLLDKATGVDIRLNVLGTPLVFYLPAMFGVGLRSGIIIYIFIQFFKGFPYELEEASWIDGCGPWKTYFRIVVPSSTVVFFTNAVFSTIWHWNDYYLAGMYINAPEKATLAVLLRDMPQRVYNLSNNIGLMEKTPILMSACLLYVLPMLIIYLFIQRKFVKSIDRVGITG